jgi:hypothetical protein
MLMLGDAMSIFARSTWAPSGNSPARMRRKRSRFSSTDRRMGRVGARRGQRAAVLAHCVGRQRVHIGKPSRDQPLGELVQLLVVVGGVVLAVAPLEAEPAHILPDRVDILHVFLDGVGVVEAEVALSAELLRDAEVEADGLGVADVQVAVRLGRKPRDDAAAIASCVAVGRNDLADEVLCGGLGRFGVGHHTDPRIVSAPARTPGYLHLRWLFRGHDD